ncbi:MAG: hypothetical protein JWL92_300 [Candidatus Nomurabacteria bacterium]|nr:hypothetical protein [Candidatus Nomurabacteria bacterium]
MTTYVALLRGIMPTNPNMRNEKLKAVFESLGLKNVTPIISSGNLVFQATTKSIPSLETKIEKVFIEQLGFRSTTIIRSKEELEKLVKKNPFKGIRDEKPNYLVVTFFKDKREEICTNINLEKDTGSDFMRMIEKTHGKDITTRTWKTVNRILTKMETLA